MTTYMLTTVDNPFNPHTEFEEWNAFDIQNGHHTSAYLARVVRSSPELSEADQRLAIEQAIDEIIEENGFAFYRKVGSTD